MTFNKEYADNPNRCPYCGSRELGAFSFEGVEDDYAFGTAECDDCGESWREDYELAFRVCRKTHDEMEMR